MENMELFVSMISLFTREEEQRMRPVLSHVAIDGQPCRKPTTLLLKAK
jgi:hypothetical protein